MLAAALDDLCDSAPAEGTQRRIDREAARPPGELGRPVHLVALALVSPKTRYEALTAIAARWASG
jgi:hypothetical protein